MHKSMSFESVLSNHGVWWCLWSTAWLYWRSRVQQERMWKLISGAGSKFQGCLIWAKEVLNVHAFLSPLTTQSKHQWMWQIPSEISKVPWTQESPIPLAGVPKSDIHKLGRGSGAWVDVAWLSRSSAALGAGARSTGERCQLQDLTQLLLSSYQHALPLAWKRKITSFILPLKHLWSVSQITFSEFDPGC